MKLSKLLERIEYKVICGDTDIEIGNVVSDSRKADENSLFICIIGANFDGHNAVGELIEKNVKAFVVSKTVPVPKIFTGTVIEVEDTRVAQAFISAAYFGYPADKLKTIGVTGTKGKTTTTYLVKSILEQGGLKVGLIGTIEAVIGDKHIPSANTTPESYLLQQYMAEMVDAGMDAVVMEVSSQGIMMHRSDGFIFDIGVFTNIEPDHIGPGEHESFEEYLGYKAKLFENCKVGLFNADDPHLPEILKNHTCEVRTFGFSDSADYRVKEYNLYSEKGNLGVDFTIEGKICDEVRIPTPGKFSIYNALTAIAVCNEFNIPMGNVKKALLKTHVKGRIEMIPISERFSLMIDYAHNAMALMSLLQTLKEYNPKRIVCLFGCGGNRSKLRRFEMGEVSGKMADLTIITSDNPRFEKPEDIIADIITGISKTDGKYIEITDRKEAIAYAINNAEDGDVIVLAGKGHEDYQEIEGKKYPMDERVIIKEITEGKNF